MARVHSVNPLVSKKLPNKLRHNLSFGSKTLSRRTNIFFTSIQKHDLFTSQLICSFALLSRLSLC